MQPGDLIYYSHQYMHVDDEFIAIVLKLHKDHTVTVVSRRDPKHKRKVLKFYCKPITKKEAFTLNLKGVSG